MTTKKLQDLPIWGHYQIRKKQGKKAQKIPVDLNGNVANFKVTCTLTYEEAKNKLDPTIHDGVNIRIEKPWCCIDLDKCIDDEGNFTQEAENWLFLNENKTFIELSSSENGVHIIGLAPKNLTANGSVLHDDGSMTEVMVENKPIALTLNELEGSIHFIEHELQTIEVPTGFLANFKASKKARSRISVVEEHNQPIKDGEVHSKLMSYLGHMRNFGLEERELRALAEMRYKHDVVENEYDQKHIEDMIKSVMKYEPRVERYIPPIPGVNDSSRESLEKREADILSRLPAWFNWYLEECTRTAAYPQPMLSLSSGLLCMAHAVRSKFVTHTNLPLNLYHINVAGKGKGKDHPREFFSEFIDAEYSCEELEKPTSDASIYNALDVTDTVTFNVDEIAYMLRGAITSTGSEGGSTVIEALLKLYKKGNRAKVPPLKGYAEVHKNKVLKYPYVNIFGSSTYKLLQKSLSSDLVEDGFLSRFMFYVGDETPETNLDLRILPAADITFGKPLIDKFRSMLLTRLMRVNVKNDAQLNRMNEIREEVRAVVPENPRAIDYFYKYSALFSMGHSLKGDNVHDSMHYEDEAIELSRDLVLLLEDRKHEHIFESIATNNIERNIKTIHKVLKSDRKGMMSTREIFLKTRSMSKRDRTEALDYLIDSGQVITWTPKTNKRGRPPVQYKLKDKSLKLSME